MMRKLYTHIVGAAVGGCLFFAGQANAAPITLTGLTFSEVGPGVTITGGIAGAGTEADPIVLFETVTGSDITISISGLVGFGDIAGTGHGTSFWLEKVVTNNTAETWEFFDHELQEIFGTASSNGDGLSFAQGCASCRPWTSDKFADINEIIDPRDFINFSNGLVAPTETVTFKYVITDPTPIAQFYLRQRPNFNPDTTDVAEPATLAILGLGLMGLGLMRRRRKSA